MSIIIDKNLCVGCKKCKTVCPGNLITIDKENKANIKYPKDCWGCASCVKECKVEAIKYYLGADMGGNGNFMYTKQEGNLLHWIIVAPDGSEKKLTTDKSKANAY